jgi:hypothetical protein
MKLPITPLLYLVSLGLAAGSVLLFLQTMKAADARHPNDIEETVKARLKEGSDREPEGTRDLYGGSHQVWWESFRGVNLTGKLPPEPEGAKPVEQEKPVEVPVKPLDEIFVVMALIHTADGKDSMVVIRYRPDANVQIPESEMPVAFSGPGDATATRPAAAGRPGAIPAAAVADPSARLIHRLRLEQKLWKPFDNIRLVRIGEDALSAWFLREDPTKDKSEWKEEEVLKKTLDLPDDVYRKLTEGGMTRAPLRAPTSNQPSSTPAESSGSAWQDVGPATRELRPGEFHVGSDDDAYLRESTERVLQDLPLREYRSERGDIVGIRVVGRIESPELQRFGVREGDVLLDLNGVPTPTRAAAIKTGKEQYERGVRDFRARILRAGQPMTLTYHWKK